MVYVLHTSQGMMLAAMFLASAFLVNEGYLSKGQAVGIIRYNPKP